MIRKSFCRLDAHSLLYKRFDTKDYTDIMDGVSSLILNLSNMSPATKNIDFSRDLYKAGSRVTWKSKSKGTEKEHIGTVVAVIPAGEEPANAVVKYLEGYTNENFGTKADMKPRLRPIRQAIGIGNRKPAKARTHTSFLVVEDNGDYYLPKVEFLYREENIDATLKAPVAKKDNSNDSVVVAIGFTFGIMVILRIFGII